MKTIFICASVDVKNAVVGDTLDRALTLSRHPKMTSLRIVSLHGEGRWSLQGLSVHGIGSDKHGKAKTLYRFLTTILKLIRQEKPDFFYLYMCPTLAPVLFPLRVLWNIPIVQWFGHAIYRKPTVIALKYFSDLWFNSNKSMAPFPVKHLHLVGQGVRADQFFYDPQAEKKFDLITVGRISPIKRIDQMIEVLKLCRDKYGKSYTLNICGDAFVKSDIEHKNKLQQMVREYGLESQVIFSGMVARDALPLCLRQAKAFLFLVHGGVGKATIECMASGLPVIISTPEANDFFGKELSSWFLCEKDNESISEAIIKILDLPYEDYKQLASKTNQLFLEKYTLEKFIDRIVTIVDQKLAK